MYSSFSAPLSFFFFCFMSTPVFSNGFTERRNKKKSTIKPSNKFSNEALMYFTCFPCVCLFFFFQTCVNIAPSL